MTGTDTDGDPKKYLLVGAYTWPVMDETPWDDVERLEVHPDWPQLKEEEALRDVEYEVEQDLAAHGEEMSYRPTSDEGETKTLELWKKRENANYQLASKSASEVLAGTQELFSLLRRHGCPVARIHTDVGREFDNNPFKRWCMQRGLARTFSPPDEHQSNGRAEAMIASIKQRVRRLLHASEMPTKWWPAAARHVDGDGAGEKAQGEHQGEASALWAAHYHSQASLGTWGTTPTPEVSKGHAVLTDKEKVKVVSYLIKDVKEPKSKRIASRRGQMKIPTKEKGWR